MHALAALGGVVVRLRVNRAPNTSWFMRRPDASRYPNGYVRTLEDDLVQLVYFEQRDYPQSLIVNRRDARLLAKRINECLDATRC